MEYVQIKREPEDNAESSRPLFSIPLRPFSVSHSVRDESRAATHPSLLSRPVPQALEELGCRIIPPPARQEPAYPEMRTEARPAGQSAAAPGRALPSMPLYQARTTDPNVHTIPYLLSTECQSRGFNPEWRVRQGEDWVSCDIVLNWVAGQRSHIVKAGGRKFAGERGAKAAMAAEALAVVRSWPTSAPPLASARGEQQRQRQPRRGQRQKPRKQQQQQQQQQKEQQEKQQQKEQQAPTNFLALSSSARELSMTAQALAQRVQDLEAQLAAASRPQQQAAQGVRTRSQSPPSSHHRETAGGYGLYRSRSPLRETRHGPGYSSVDRSGAASDSGRYIDRATTNNRRNRRNNNPDRHYSPDPFDQRNDYGRLSPPPGLYRLAPRPQPQDTIMRDREPEPSWVSGHPRRRAQSGGQNLAVGSARVERWEHDRYIKREGE